MHIAEMQPPCRRGPTELGPTCLRGGSSQMVMVFLREFDQHWRNCKLEPWPLLEGNCQRRKSLLSDADRSQKHIKEQRAMGRSRSEPNQGLPCREGLNLFMYKNIRITLPVMYMNSGGNLKLTEDRAKTVKEIFCFDSICPYEDVYSGIGLFFFNISVSLF